MIYVLNSKGLPLMPTCRNGKVRHLLRDKKAAIVNLHPFTIQLSQERSNVVQPITLGVDTGYENVGLSATTEKKVLFECNVKLRSDISNNIATRKQLRRSRRSRKARYRESRFMNRRRCIGWLPPSVQSRVDAQKFLIAKVHKILPIATIVVEVAKFDIHKLKNPMIEGSDYQHGEQMGFWNVREYVLCRDGHKSRKCKGKSNDYILNVHHIESRRTGGNAPDNLITLCETCHKNYHKGLISLEGIKRGNSYKSESFMCIMKNFLVNSLTQTYNNVLTTFGYITKNARINNHLKKDHNIDARCISGNPNAEPPKEIYLIKKVRCHNRKIHKCKFLKGGKRLLNQSPYLMHGFRLFDKVLFDSKTAFVYGRRLNGSFLIKNIHGNTISSSISYKKLKLLKRRSGWIMDYDVCLG